jgi:glycosyltransferase involved in cell wall biosynthesis
VGQQTYRGELEVIICIDGSTDGTQEMLRGFKDFPLQWFDTGEMDRNTAAKARNLGIANARGEILVMMDDDCLPHKQLIETYVSWFNPREIQTGYRSSIEAYLNLPLPVPIEAGRMAEYQKAADAGKFGYFVTGNTCMATDAARNQAKDGSIGFDERFVGYGHEDTEFGRRLVYAGYKIIWTPQAVAWHMNPSACPQQDPAVKAEGRVNSNRLLHQILQEVRA